MNRSNPLQGKRVLITRAPAQSETFARMLQEQGAIPVFAPLIAFVDPDDPQPAQHAVASAGRYAWIVFTSANGVRAFFDRARFLHAQASQNYTASFAAIGPGTASALQAHGVQAAIVPESFVAEELASLVVHKSEPGDRVLLFGAQESRDTLAQLLREHERVVDAVAGYKTVAVHDEQFAQKAASCDILTFASASAVRAFGANVPAMARACEGKIVACIGPITAQAAREHGVHVDVVAQDFTAQGLRDALRQHFE